MYMLPQKAKARHYYDHVSHEQHFAAALDISA